jgi:hypothetical protein
LEQLYLIIFVFLVSLPYINSPMPLRYATGPTSQHVFTTLALVGGFNQKESNFVIGGGEYSGNFENIFRFKQIKQCLQTLSGACGAHGGGEGCIQHFGWEA